MVMTDVGARCPVCAPQRKLPQFEIGPLLLLRGIGGALLAGAGIGLLWGLLAGAGFGFFTIFIGVGAGYGVAAAVNQATSGKSGTGLQVAAAAGVVLAYFLRNLLAFDTLLPQGDLFGYLAVLGGVVVAVNQLRF